MKQKVLPPKVMPAAISATGGMDASAPGTTARSPEKFVIVRFEKGGRTLGGQEDRQHQLSPMLPRHWPLLRHTTDARRRLACDMAPAIHRRAILQSLLTDERIPSARTPL